MAAVLPVDTAKLKNIVQVNQKQQEEKLQETKTQQAAAKSNQSVFGATEYKSDADVKNKNTTAFSNLDQNAQSIIKSHFVDKSWAPNGGYGDMKAIISDLNKNGYSAKSVEMAYTDWKGSKTNASGNTYPPAKGIEINTPDGKTYKLWDANGDGGFGGADLQLDQNLKDFVSDAKAASNNGKVSQVAGTQAAESPNALKAADKTQTVFDKAQTVADKAKNVDDKQILNYLKADLRSHGNVAEKEIEPKAQEMLPIYKMLLALDLPWLNRLFNLEV